ncbi:GntR family transcriptional regulator [Streptomyces sp. URMC 126]|uniref:GntR family transcriptional regulator n=1 Tax=Streptomyces sp. URMC 126 TaxID=3423401 RepID=UPI003F1D6A71
MREQPPYLRIADVLRQRIADQEWTPGARLPSRAQIAQECGVGENVVRRAQELLISQGVLEGRAGSGTYVAKPRERARLLRSAWRDGQPGDGFGLGPRATWESQSEAKVPVPAHIAARLGIDVAELCVRTAYEFMIDGRPAQLITSWEPYSLTGGTIVVLPEGGPLAGKGVPARMAEIGITVSHAEEAVEAGQATAEEANLLGVQRGSLVTRVRRTYYGDDGRPVETADIVVPVSFGEIVYEVPVSR